MENKYSWNKTLKFSWGHIIACVAIIFLSYVMYMGAFYSNGGDFIKAAITVAILDFCLLLTFIGAQVLKGVETHFKRNLRIERILIVLCPVAFAAAMFPYNHFWNVLAERDQIEKEFNTSVTTAKLIFDDYDIYTKDRIANYDAVLDSLMANDSSFTKTSKANYLRALELQLKSENTEYLKELAIQWIDNANSGASVWNAFLIGNIDQITSAINGWRETLVSYSEPVLSNEAKYGNVVTTFATSGDAFTNSLDGLNRLSKIYVKEGGVNVNTIWTGVILFLMLIFPYLLQARNTRANGIYSLFPHFSRKNKKRREKPIATDDEGEESESGGERPTDSGSDDLYGGTF